MNRTANVHSIDALDRFRAALSAFGEAADLSLTMIRMELDRFVDWLEHDQLKFWQGEIRRCEDRVGEAKTDLHRCLAATVDRDHTPSCYQEKKAVEVAKRKLEEANEKLAAVRRWIPPVRQAVLEYRMRAEPLSSALLGDVPKATMLLQKLSAQLASYLELSSSTGGPEMGTATTTSPDEAAPAAAPISAPGAETVAAPAAEAASPATPDQAAAPDAKESP